MSSAGQGRVDARESGLPGQTAGPRTRQEPLLLARHQVTKSLQGVVVVVSLILPIVIKAFRQSPVA